jgi:ribose 1,5-bisphosphokinase
MLKEPRGRHGRRHPGAARRADGARGSERSGKIQPLGRGVRRGKDTLIDAARERFGVGPRFLFPRRAVTRRGQRGEPCIPLSEEEFEPPGPLLPQMARPRAVLWRPGGGARRAGAGRTVVVNVSREMNADARRLWSDTRLLHVTASAEARRKRLTGRGRETVRELAGRLKRADAKEALVPRSEWVTEIDSSGRRRWRLLGERHGENAASRMAGRRLPDDVQCRPDLCPRLFGPQIVSQRFWHCFSV